mgnify:CR=1 FL=1
MAVLEEWLMRPAMEISIVGVDSFHTFFFRIFADGFANGNGIAVGGKHIAF